MPNNGNFYTASSYVKIRLIIVDNFTQFPDVWKVSGKITKLTEKGYLAIFS